MTILSVSMPAVRPRIAVPSYASWQDAFKDAVRDAGELCRLLDLPASLAAEANMADPRFGLFASRSFVARMRPDDSADPLLRQVLPLVDEARPADGFVADPVSDTVALRQPGFLQKYRGRALLVTTGTCAVHCRYCFRRHFSYDDAPRSVSEWQPVLADIAADTSLSEIILSGGDPLALVDTTLNALVGRLEEIPHLRRLRIHTRLPIMIPERVTNELAAMLHDCRLTPIVVVHANHANELDRSVADALAKLTDSGAMLLNQAVLLAGVNDSLDAQQQLCERLVDLRVMPYYLHQLDPVAGAAHFEVPISVGRQIINELRRCLPGYAVPRYVQEISGQPNKILLA